MLISTEYQRLNAQLHQDRDDYGKTSKFYVPIIAHNAKVCGAKTLLDYGCGKGLLKAGLAETAPELSVSEYDPAIPGKDTDPSPADLVVSIDVMEHIEPEYIRDVIAHIASKTIKGCFMTISLTPAAKTLADGRNAHLIVKPKEWWFFKLKRHFQIKGYEVADHGSVFSVYLEPRK